MNDVLELETIKKQICQYTHFSLGTQYIMETKPSFELLKIKKMLAQTKEATEIVRLHGNPPFGGIHDIRAAVAAAMKNAICNERELVMCASLMRGCRSVGDFIHNCDSEVISEISDSMMIDMRLAE